jgi:hypothetical protein
MTHEWKALIDKAYDRGAVVVAFEGGEPTMRLDLRDLVSHAKSRGLVTIIVTNGTNGVAGYGADSVWVSIDGPQEVHDSIRGEGSFVRTMESIRSGCESTIMAICTLSERNACCLPEMLESLKDKVDGFVLNWLYPSGQSEDRPLSGEALKQVCSLLANLKSVYPILNSRGHLRSVIGRWTCRDWLMTIIDPSGKEPEGCLPVAMGDGRDCARCRLGCYIDLDLLFRWDFETRAAWNRYAGVAMVLPFEIRARGLARRLFGWFESPTRAARKVEMPVGSTETPTEPDISR